MLDKHVPVVLDYYGTPLEGCIFKLLLGGGPMANSARNKITLACTECKQRNYDMMKEKKNHPEKMETKKYCKFCKKHTVHKETK